MCPSPAAGAHPHSALRAARVSTASNRSIWRRKDSSETIPTTPSEAGCICPAEPVSSSSPSSSSESSVKSTGRCRLKQRSTRLQSQYETAREPSGMQCPSPVSFLSLPASLAPLQQLSEDDHGLPEPTLPPILAPLEPLHPPPVRRATPPGLPSYEPNRRAQPWISGGRCGTGLHSTSTLGLRGFSLSNSVSRWRRSRQNEGGTFHGHGDRGGCTSRAPVGSVWRPPTSQHSLANHPYLRDMPPAERAAQADRLASRPAGRLDLPRTGRTRITAGGPSAVAMAETEARAGRASLPVTLDDYRFLRRSDYSGAAGVANAEDRQMSLPSAVLCFRWCVPPGLCPDMSRHRTAGNFAVP